MKKCFFVSLFIVLIVFLLSLEACSMKKDFDNNDVTVNCIFLGYDSKHYNDNKDWINKEYHNQKPYAYYILVNNDSSAELEGVKKKISLNDKVILEQELQEGYTNINPHKNSRSGNLYIYATNEDRAYEEMKNLSIEVSYQALGKTYTSYATYVTEDGSPSQ